MPLPPSSSTHRMIEEEALSRTLTSSLQETSVKSKQLLSDINEHLRSDEFDATRGDGLDFLEVKNSIMVSYLADMTHLMHLKLTRRHKKSTADKAAADEATRRCLHRLDEMRVCLDKIRPLERKMSYQLDKLLALAVTASSATTNDGGGELAKRGPRVSDEDGGEGGAAAADASEGMMASSDPLSFRPNPDALMGKDEDDDDDNQDDASVDSGASDDEEGGADRAGGGGGESSSSDDDDEDLKAAKEAARLSTQQRKKNKGTLDSENDAESSYGDAAATATAAGLYRAPRLSSVQYLDQKHREEASAKRLEKKQRERMRKSELLQTLKNQLGDQPEEDDVDGGALYGKTKDAAKSLLQREAEREHFEEDTFVRLTVSRKEKKERNRIRQEEKSNLRSISDLGNLASGIAAFEHSGGSDSRAARRSGDLLPVYDDDDVEEGGDIGSYGNGGDARRRHANGKRRREAMDVDRGSSSVPSSSSRRKSRSNSRGGRPKNSLQGALYGMDTGGGGSGKKKRKSKNKRSR